MDGARQWDWWLLGAALALVGASMVAMMSAAATVHDTLIARHALWMLFGIILCGLVGCLPAPRVVGSAALLYGVSVASLLLVMIAGTVRLGATRWLSLFGVSLQPSELAKLATVAVLARYLAGQPHPLPSRVILTSLVLSGAPLLLVFFQPDLGSASILGVIWLGMIWVGGASRRTLAVIGACVVMAIPVGWHVLKAYQRARLLAFLNPHADPLGAGYTIIQSTIAMGSGGLWGRGWLSGTQHQLQFLPEHHSDFIFSVIGEEWGWFGCLAVIVAFGVLLSRINRLGVEAPDDHTRLVAAGCFSWIGYQACANMGMVIGLLPVVGVPLPFVSYGGSSMVTLWAALGILLALRRAR